MNIPPVILEILSVPTVVRDAVEWHRREVREFINRHRAGVTIAAVSAATAAALGGAAGAGAALAEAKASATLSVATSSAITSTAPPASLAAPVAPMLSVK